MTPEQAIRDAQAAKLLPVYIVVGEERVLVDRVVCAVRQAALEPTTADFNTETLTAGETDMDQLMASVRMVPMMAARRVVLVRNIDHWEPSSTTAALKKRTKGKEAKESDTGVSKARQKASSKTAAQSPMDRLCSYLQNPVGSTVLIATASKLDKRRKLMNQAVKAGYAVICNPLSSRELPRFVLQEAKARGHSLPHEVAERIAQMTGPRLSDVIDAVERLSLFVGENKPITAEAVNICVSQLRGESVWTMVDAVGNRNLATALAILNDVYDPRDRGLKLIGLLAWSTRQLLKFSVARQNGATAEQAALQAGIPPFKARQMAEQVNKLQPAQLEKWLQLLAQTDIALKSSRRPPRAIVESAIMSLTMISLLH